eukprot:CAMPEP_0169205272 /NCGR_PEP_ID=MMETSP1016-20121227/12430_1 /TAXON_ID=342587 /ORGANISM="Karlodinium micrum, Strain CCMP2283" /LENGTH=105 /DNA_ID=CAMNT_0009282409 /DNA_START=1 /DNA_END=318 /DNA_ORIENTATION=-
MRARYRHNSSSSKPTICAASHLWSPESIAGACLLCSGSGLLGSIGTLDSNVELLLSPLADDRCGSAAAALLLAAICEGKGSIPMAGTPSALAESPSECAVILAFR